MRNIRAHGGHVIYSERRGQDRHPAIENAAQVAWREGDDRHTTAAQLMDVSRDGLLVLVDDEPPLEASVSIRLIQPAATDWIEVNVVESLPTRYGPYQLRISFIAPPPAGFLTLTTALPEDEED